MKPWRIKGYRSHISNQEGIGNQYTHFEVYKTHILGRGTKSGKPACKSEDRYKTAMFADSCPYVPVTVNRPGARLASEDTTSGQPAHSRTEMFCALLCGSFQVGISHRFLLLAGDEQGLKTQKGPSTVYC